jgi:hypothetical protein
MLHVYNVLRAEGALPAGPETAALASLLVKKSSKSESGVLVVTVLTSPFPEYTDPASGERITQKFSCEWDCYYCPDEPEQPRSYLHDEPSVRTGGLLLLKQTSLSSSSPSTAFRSACYISAWKRNLSLEWQELRVKTGPG